jgi:hypothetical protein
LLDKLVQSVQYQVGKNGAEYALNNVGKLPIIIETVIPRTQLRASYGQGFGNADKPPSRVD